jgi:hypothetical protein
MRGSRLLELISTRHFLSASLLLTAVTLLVLWLAVYMEYATLDDVAKGADVAVKIGATILAGAWVLNRYFTSRTDSPQLRVELTLDVVERLEFDPPAPSDLLMYRVDIINTGKTLIRVLEQTVSIAEVKPGPIEPSHTVLRHWKWPNNATSSVRAIEPGSWAAVNESIQISPSVAAVRVYLDLHLQHSGHWTWHRSLRIPRRGLDFATGWRLPNRTLDALDDTSSSLLRVGHNIEELCGAKEDGSPNPD